jgi:DNA-directed RNA polymerase subunit M/transcription elongation factor TFIIS
MPKGIYDKSRRKHGSIYPLKTRVICKKCFNVFSPDTSDKRTTCICPFCGRIIDIRNRTGYAKKYADTHPERKKTMVEYDKKYGRERRAIQKTRMRKVVFNLISNNNPICANCGCDDERLLEINHINGGGRKEYNNGKNTAKFWWSIYMGRRKTDDLNLLCRVCNALHYHESKFGKLPYKIIWGKNV